MKHSNEEFILSTNKILDNVFAIDHQNKPKDIMRILEIIVNRFKALSEQEQTDLKKWIDQILRHRLPETNREEILEKIKRGEVSMVHGWDLAFKNERKEGRKEGKKEKEIELTERFLKMGITVEQIMEGTGLTEKEVMKIKARLNI